MKRIPKLWGYELTWAQTDKYIGKTLHINAGKTLIFNGHVTKEKTILIQYGRVQLEYYSEIKNNKNKDVLDMVPGDSFHINPGVSYRIIACQAADIVELSTPELNDNGFQAVEINKKVKYEDKNEKISFVRRFFNWLRSRINHN